MASTNTRITDRFSAPTSSVMLAGCRRPNYCRINNKQPLELVDAASVFFIWSLEGEEKLYRQINDALLYDNYKALKKYEAIISELKEAIKLNPLQESVKVYRKLTLDSQFVLDEYAVGKTFLCPNFCSTSRDKNVALNFRGNYLLEINLSPKDGYTYCADISRYSKFPKEKEILIYPYSGFRIKKFSPDCPIIELDCVDTLQVESYTRKLIPNEINLFDNSRQLYVHFYKKSRDVHCSSTKESDQRRLIAQNPSGYWDTYYRYHHINGYFVNKGNHIWEEYHNNKRVACFREV